MNSYAAIGSGPANSLQITQGEALVSERSNPLDFLAGGGEMGERLRAYPWSQSSLGSPDTWPASLRTTIRILLTTEHPVFIFWGENLLCFYNNAYCRSLGPEKHPDMLGQPAREHWAEIWPIIGPQIEQVMQGALATWHENQLVPIIRHGKLQDVYWTYSFGPIDEPSAPQGVGGVLVLCTETTQQVLTERRMTAERESFAQLFEQAPTFMCLLRGPNHVFELANPGFVKLTGNRPLVGFKLVEALPETAEQGFVKILDETYASGVPYNATGAEYLVPVESGAPEKHFVDFVYQPIRDADGTVTGIFVEGADVTQRALADAALREANQRKDEFLAMLAHELRNPLAPIRTAAEVLARRIVADETAQGAVDVVRRQSTQLTRIVDDLLDVSRISMGRIELKHETLLLKDVIDHAMETVAPAWRTKSHQVSVVTGLEPLYVKGDLARLVQSLGNVMSNAAKYTGSGGKIGIRVTSTAHTVTVEISDNGAGIAPEFMPHIFELFAQADRTLDRSQGGLGIGLSVVKKLIEMHNGSITARSDGLSRGATFEITLPRAAAPSTQLSGAAAPMAATRRILIVDDNVDAANTLSELLQLDGHETKPAFTAADALIIADTFRPEIVLLDIGLPQMNGYEVARRLRASKLDGHTTLIALTGYGQVEDREKALAAGFDAHLVKPVDFAALAKLLADH
jgi:signal transduction histidine kinase